MQKIFSAEQIRQWDAYTITHEPIASIQLMERAAGKCFDWIIENFIDNPLFLICCGNGNNGGDGFALARMLHKAGCRVSVFVPLHDGSKLSPDAKTNYDLLDKSLLCSDKVFETTTVNDVVIDCLFGTGLNAAVAGEYAHCIAKINAHTGSVISVDVPSGLFVDKANNPGDAIVQATHTLTFQSTKFSFLLPLSGGYCGNLHILDIGLNKKYWQSTQVSSFILEHADIAARIKPRPSFSHKGTFGHALIVGGSRGKAGAAILTSHACLRAGVGLVSVITEEECIIPLQSALPEAMCEIRHSKDDITNDVFEKYTAIGIGPGLLPGEMNVKFMEKIFVLFKKNMVIDADGINLLARNKQLLELLPHRSIITPHEGELARLVGKWSSDFEKIELVKKFCAAHHCYIIIKGHRTCTVTPEGELYFNSTGNNGMATAGSGDVLAGILTALLAQGYNPLDAALAGVYIHGYAGDKAAELLTPTCIIASDIINHLPHAFKDFIS